MSEELIKVDASGMVVAADYDYEATGFENQTRDDRSTPYLTLLQTNSPQCAEVADGGIEGAKPGMFMNSATEEVYDGRDEGILLVPAYTEHLYVEYRPRDEGGGFVGIHPFDGDVVRQAKQEAVAFNRLSVHGNDLTEAFYVYGVLCDGDEPIGGIVVPFTSTKIKAYKKWNTRVSTLLVPRSDGRRATPPLFAHLVRIKSLKQENQHGKFFIFEISPANGDVKNSLLPPNDPRVQAGEALMKSVSAGELKAAQPEAQGAASEGGDNIPF